MKMLRAILCLAALALCGPAPASPVDISLAPDAANPARPEMGDWLHFRSAVRNAGKVPLSGLVVWISLVEVDPGHEQPVDLEDWSAQKAAVLPSLLPGEKYEIDWPMRLIQAGDYRVLVSAAERGAPGPYASPFADFHVRRKPTVESARILPVALGVPVLLAGLAAWRLRRGR
jgi:hypothetical protein